MKIGTLVRWTGDSEDKDCMGLVSSAFESGFRVIWADGVIEEYYYYNSHHRYVEVICEENLK